MIETAVLSLLEGDPVVSGLVATRIGPAPLLQGDPASTTRPQVPAITYQRISPTEIDVDLEGAEELARIRLQLDCWALKASEVRALATAVRQALNGYAGTVGGRRVRHVGLISGGGDAYEPDTKLRRVTMDFRISCDEGEA